MRHLALPVFCAVVVGLLLSLLLRAIQIGADSFALGAVIGIAFFANRCLADARANWPAFTAEMKRRRAERQRAPMPADDTH